MAQSVRSKRSGGFTLIELLIAITILSLVIGLATYSFSLFSKQWSNRDVAARWGVSRLQRVELVSRALEDSIPWLVRQSSGLPGFYFLGRDEGFTFVTGSPIFADNVPAVVRLFREQSSDGSWQLVYEEASLRGLVLQSVDQQLPFKHRLIVVDRRREISFRYFGWESVEAKSASGDDFSLRPRWFTEYDGLTRVQHPQSIAVGMGDIEAVYEIASRSDVAINQLLTDQ
jgi:prepilin-type N-terminal cleavage/methylation domain-containing protein